MSTLVLLISTAATVSQANDNDDTMRRIHVPVLMYHYVGELPEEPDDIRINLTLSTQLFRQHLAYLRDQRYTTITFEQLNAALDSGAPLPPNPVILTFDDGHLDHYTNVFPALLEFGFTGTFFVVTGFIDQNNPNYLSWDQVIEMHEAGMSIEAHTKTHPDLRDRDNDFLIYQILGSIESVYHYTKRRPTVFSYPAGRYDQLTVNVTASTGIMNAVTTQNGTLHTTTDNLLSPRLRITNETGVAGLAGLLLNSRP